MPSKSLEARDEQKKYWEDQLRERLKLLDERGLPSSTVKKDPMVRKIKAQIRATNRRMVVIERRREKTKEMARIKAEKSGVPKKEKAKKKKVTQEESGPSKRQLKKRMKKEGKEK